VPTYFQQTWTLTSGRHLKNLIISIEISTIRSPLFYCGEVLHGTRTSGDLFTAGLKAEMAFCINRSFSSADVSSFMSNTHSAITSIEKFPKILEEFNLVVKMVIRAIK